MCLSFASSTTSAIRTYKHVYEGVALDYESRLATYSGEVGDQFADESCLDFEDLLKNDIDFGLV